MIEEVILFSVTLTKNDGLLPTDYIVLILLISCIKLKGKLSGKVLSKDLKDNVELLHPSSIHEVHVGT